MGCNVLLLAEQPSIFGAYAKGLSKLDAKPDDVVILCHDDVTIQLEEEEFRNLFTRYFEDKDDTGFIGPAGTSFLGHSAVWWDRTAWKNGMHRGSVDHVSADGSIYNTYYGPEGQVVVLDGLFLAAKRRVLDEIGLDKPDYFEGEWDFYDIHYTSQAHKAGYKNYGVHMPILHESAGELVGRDSWHANREAFIRNTELPLKLT